MEKRFNLALFTEGFWLNEIRKSMNEIKAAKKTMKFEECHINNMKQLLQSNLKESEYEFFSEIRHEVLYFKIKINCNDKQSFFIESYYSYAYKVPGDRNGGLRAFPNGISIYHSTRRAPHNAAQYSLYVDENNLKEIILNIIEIKNKYTSIQSDFLKELDKAQNKIETHNQKANDLKNLMTEYFPRYAITPTNNGANECYTIGIDSENILELHYQKKDVLNELKDISMKLPGFAAIIDILPGVVSIEVNNRRGI